MTSNMEFTELKEYIEILVKEYLINQYGKNSINSVVLRKRLLIIKLNIIKTSTVKNLINFSIEKKFGELLRNNQLSFKIKFISK